MEQNINQLIGILLRAEENEIPTEVIIDSVIAYDVACVLSDELGKDFEDIGCEFEELLDTEDILGVSVDFFRGKSIYFLQPVISDDGETLRDEVAEEVYIHEDVFNLIDTKKFDGDIILMEEIEEEVSEFAEELEEYFEDATSDLIEDIHDGVIDEDFCIHCAIKEALQNAYSEGYKDTQMALRDILDENIERME
jgi:hypothetical protein